MKLVLVTTIVLLSFAQYKAEESNIMGLLEARENLFSILLHAIKVAGLDGLLENRNGSYTLFAPTNVAFSTLDPQVLEELFSDTDNLKFVLSSHIVRGAFSRDRLLTTGKLRTQDGYLKTIIVNGNTISVENSTIIQADMEATNGVVHAIDAVILFPVIGY